MGMPLREYYSVKRAAELLECRVEDLFCWASVGSIKIYANFESGNGIVRFFGDGVEKENRDLTRFLEEDFESSLLLKNEYSNHPVISDGLSYVYHNENYVVDNEDDVPDKSYPCRFSGLWALPFSFFGVGLLYDFQPALYDLWSSVNSKMFVSFKMDEQIHFDAVELLYVVKSDFILIKNSKNEELPNYCNGGVQKPNSEGGIPTTNPGVRDYHAAKREEVLRAALYMKANFPDKCSNYSEWANAINDHAHKFWSDGNPPLSVKSISELLGRAHKLPSEY